MVQAGEAGPRLNASLGHPVCSRSESHHGYYYLGLLFTEHLLYARLYAKSFPSQHHLAVGIFTMTPGTFHHWENRLWTLHHVTQSGGGRALGLSGNFSCVPSSELKTNRRLRSHLSASFSTLSSPPHPPHPSSCPLKSHPLLLVLDVKND